MCVPRFDSGACFAALLGGPENGRFLLAPRNADATRTERRYREGTLVLETTFQTSGGRVRVRDVMPPRDRTPDVVRVVEGLDGEVDMRMELVIRCDYGSTLPWVSRLPDGRLRAIPVSGRQFGNFPQAFSHVGLVNTAYNLNSTETMPARLRRDG